MTTYDNPIVEANCPDPAVARSPGEPPAFYAVCTTNVNEEADKFPLYRSTDLVSWLPVGFLFPYGAAPAWAERDFWAPEIHRIDQRYLAYFTARDRTGSLCIGVASATSPEGPWHPDPQPLLRDPEIGLIDAHLFQSRHGRRYLYWKEDGNDLEPPRPCVINGQEVAADGVTLTGEPIALMTNNRPWEGDVVEGPWVVQQGGAYYMFYSGNKFNSERYATGVARAASPLGPYHKYPEPILRSNAKWSGPGHGSVISTDDDDFFIYHAWQAGHIDEIWNEPVHPRMMLMDPIKWVNGWPQIADATPSTTPTPRPRI